MGSSNSNGMPQAGQDRSLFALVIYIPDPLGRFLDDLRRELVPGCNPHAHVSVLPPRPLSVDVRSACEQARLIAEEFHPFDVEAGEIEIFPTTNVVYINLARGSEELRGMHRTMNRDGLGFQEPFSYHPHITLPGNQPRAGTATGGVSQAPLARVSGEPDLPCRARRV